LKFYRARMTTLATELGYADLPALLIRLTGDEKHDSSSLSTLDVLWVLYDRVLAAKGILPLELLDDFGSFGSALGHHPDRVLVPGAEIGSGSLGHGLPIAVGRALAGRRTFVLVGDGELDEGSNWEAVQFAGRVGLDPLTVVVVDNDSSTYHWPGGIEPRFALEGWHAVRVDGRDHDALAAALCNRVERRPGCVVAEVRR
jgi:transketolase